jgi:23S rRNA pseudouridine1911/1915/1917 synthase
VSRRLLPVPDGLDGERVDAGLARLLGLSRSRAAEIVAAGGVVVAGRGAAKSDRLVAGSLLEVELPDRPAAPGPAPVPGMAVLFEDDDVVVVDKPAGIAAHPSPGWTGATVVGGLAAAGRRISTSGAEERQGVVHRLDVGTTGVMAVAKSERAYSDLKEQFRRRTVAKRYHALVQGHPDPSAGTIDAPVGRHPAHPHKWAVVAGGRSAVTHYETLEARPAVTLLDIRLETGRTHQIRVHTAAVRHPCVGDLLYGADPVLAESLGLGRQWLHAVELGFRHPGSGEWTVVRSPYPDDLREALARL